MKALFIDFGNVLYLADQMIAFIRFSRFSPFSPRRIYKLIYLDKIEKIPDEGGSFEDFYEKSIYAIKADKKRLEPEIFRKIWCDIFSPVPGMDRLLSLVKPEIRMILVSNTNAVHWEGRMSKLPLIRKYFAEKENQVLSYKVGKRKPDKLMWADACKKANCQPNKAFFLDDFSEFVSSFKEFGGNGLLFNAKTDSIFFLESTLRIQNII
ncbi:hypothetical protein K8R32_01120 [bacterium]|nr:hypothetical protein [bacterium]